LVVQVLSPGYAAAIAQTGLESVFGFASPDFWVFPLLHFPRLVEIDVRYPGV
jgi:hypothetical protein